jgi:glycerol-3-phosphate acyltransferase PlsX
LLIVDWRASGAPDQELNQESKIKDQKSMITIAVDAMGGDHAPAAIVDGAVAAARHLDIEVALAGPSAALEERLAPHRRWHSLRLVTVDAPEAIGMAEPPAASLRRKPRASIRIACEMVADGRAAALVSAGNTGATVMAAHAAFGLVRGVDRPALATTIPTRGRPAVLLDAGANAECRPHHLLQFALMGGVYARVALGVPAPRIGLLSIGEEETKGNELTREAHRLLRAAPIDFIGNVEGREIYSGGADVIVCDGFTGNVVLKTSEGLVDTVEALLGDELQGTFSSQVGYLLSRRAFRRFRRRVDYSEYGGAPLLGVAGIAIVCHGRSSSKAIRNAIAMAYRFSTSEFIQRIEQELAGVASMAGMSAADRLRSDCPTQRSTDTSRETPRIV